jgi:hypothetical protein
MQRWIDDHVDFSKQRAVRLEVAAAAVAAGAAEVPRVGGVGDRSSNPIHFRSSPSLSSSLNVPACLS